MHGHESILIIMIGMVMLVLIQENLYEMRTQLIISLIVCKKEVKQKSYTIQTGRDNMATTDQYNYKNFSITQQDGYDNTATTMQDGMYNFARTYSLGADNMSSIMQTSNYDKANVWQDGNNNNSVVTQK